MGALIGSMAGVGLNFFGQERANSANAAMANNANAQSWDMMREQQRYGEQMSNTAYRRGVVDMKEAGINPMMAFSQGGASTPSPGGGGTTSGAAQQNSLQGIQSSAIDVIRMNKELAQADSGIALNQASATKALADAEASGASAKQSSVATEAAKSQLKAVAAEAAAREKKAKWDTKLGDYDALAGRAARESGTAKKVIDMFKPFQQNSPEGSMHIDKDGAILKQY
ncbi:MAG: DNA pilot protein [Arizlama microvirus]|nr:MAG: DNA pilot protein [Arizlama microvirus]